MAKPRLILADTDAEYLFPIQQKFVEEYFEKIDLEIITDSAYFGQLFETPQRAEVLVVSEKLYHTALQKHNIGKVFLLTEEKEEDGTDDLAAEKIYKYSSIRDVFHEIVGKSGPLIHVDSAGKKEPQIIVVTSAAGGVGKTTVAMGLAGCLSNNYKKVLYLNSSRLQCFGYLLKNPAVIASNEIYAKISRTGLPVYPEVRHLIRRELFSYLPPFKASFVSLGIRPEIYTEIARQAKKEGEYDVIILDTDSSFDETMAGMLTAADRVVVVTGQGRGAEKATEALVQNINGLSDDKFIFLCNHRDGETGHDPSGPEGNSRFAVHESIGYMADYDRMQGADLAEQPGIRKTAFLLD